MKGVIIILTVGVFLFSFLARAEEQEKVFSQITAQEEAYIKTLLPGQAVFLDKIIVYKVKEGDTLPGTVEKYCFTNDLKEVERIARANGIKNNEINQGDRIELPIEPWRQRQRSSSPPPKNLKVK